MPADKPSPEPHPSEAAKRALRRHARAVRDAIAPQRRADAAQTVAARGLPPALSGAGAIGAYYPARSEFDPLPLLNRLAGEGHIIALPVIVGDAPLLFRRWTPGAPLDAGPFGIMRPPSSADPIGPALLLIPLLAFDGRGHRLGYGGGHYDRTLEALRRAGEIVAAGLAFDEQEVADIPAGPFDQRLDWVITPKGARRF